MMSLKQFERVKALKIGEKIVISWTELPNGRPSKGAVIGNGLQFFILEPRDNGLEFLAVNKDDALEYRKEREEHIGQP